MELRPTSDPLKETLFNIVGPVISGAVMLDVFGGSGAIGIEALSRGARQAVFVDNAAGSCRLIKKNIELCGIKTGHRILQQDAFRALRSLAREGFKANIVFFDPPYDWKPYEDLLELVFARGLLAAPSHVVIEHHRKAMLPESGSGFRRSRVIRQGDHCLSFYQEDRRQNTEDRILNSEF
jgi:16S rRNA (guanine966-N2)-methyltransferase